MKRKLPFALLSVLLCSALLLGLRPGCGPGLTPRGQFVAGCNSLAAVVNSLADLRAQGVFGDEQAGRIDELIGLAQLVLAEWEAAVEIGDEDATAALIYQFNAVMRKLVVARNAGARHAIPPPE